MEVTIKTLEQKIFKLTVDPSETVLDVKKRIEGQEGHLASAQKLIFSGKILADEKSIESLHLKEKDFLVVLVAKPKPSPATPAKVQPTTTVSSTAQPIEPSAPAQTSASAPTPTPAPESAGSAPSTTTTTTERVPAQTDATAPAPAPEQQQQQISTDNSFLGGSQLESTIANMMEMGFAREECTRALRAAFNNPDRAVEYLMTGIPAGLAQSNPAQNAAAAETDPSANAPAAAQSDALAPSQNLFEAASESGPHETQAHANPLAGSADSAEALQHLRQIVAEDPAILQQMLQGLAASNPALAQQISQNPEAILQYLSQSAAAEEDDDLYGAGGAEGGAADAITVTPAENEAIERLVALGFSKEAAAQAYLVCDKNEEVAANFLFSNDDFN